MRCSTAHRRVFHSRGDVIGRHDCPVCRTAVSELHRPGRPRIYCSNACRQRAYRWRRRHDARLHVARDGPADMLCNDRLHARRHLRDPVAQLRDRRRRQPTACGLFATRLRSEHRWHNRFVPESPSSCESCIALVGVVPAGCGTGATGCEPSSPEPAPSPRAGPRTPANAS